jgi:hypothetical protein
MATILFWKADEYNLADTGITTLFFYDGMEDLDAYILNNFIPVSSLNYSNKET